MKNIYLIIITFFFLTNKSTAQVPGIKWQRCIGGLQNEAMFDLNSEADANISNTIKSKGLIIAKGGGYFIAGQTNSSTGDVPVNAASNQPGTIAVLRLDNDRNILWKKTLGGLNSSGKYDEFNAIIETSDQGCMVIGYTASTTGQAAGNHGGSDILLGKFSASGTLEWSKVFGGTADEQGVNIIQTSDSGYVFLGNTYSTSGQVQGNHGSSDVWMVKIDKIGTLKWQKCVGTAASETAFKLEKTSNEGFIYLWQGANCTGFTLTKTDSLGFELSQTCINGFTAFGGMSQTYDGGYIIAGTGPSLSGMAVKIDNAGLIQWQKILNGSGTDVFNDAKQAPDGGYIIAGGTRSNDGDLTGLGIHSKNDAWIVKLNAGGQLEWQKLLGGSEGDVAVTIFPTLDIMSFMVSQILMMEMFQVYTLIQIRVLTALYTL